MTTIKLSELLAPSFHSVHRAIMDGTATQIVLKGGRGSCKSSYASVEMVMQLLRHSDLHAVVMRKVANTMRTTVFAQYVWAVTELGLLSYFRVTTTPMELTYKPTGQKIMFFGADDPGKIKSIKVPFGYIGLLHLEELDQFDGEEEVRNIEQSVMRGGPIAIEFKSFNPPRTILSWANKYCMRDKPGQLIHSSDYRTAPPAWLGQRFLDDAQYLKEIDPAAYAHEYLGEANGTGGAVFGNVRSKNISGEEIKSFDRIYHGVDWGWYPDPWAYNGMHFDAGRRSLYIFRELTRQRTGNRETADLLLQILGPDDRVMADSAEPKSVSDYKSFGLNCRGAEKGPGSVDYSMKWLAALANIYIDPGRCPDTWREFTEYEYERNKDGEIVSGYPDANNHHIDAVRYALEPVWKRRGN